MPDAVAHLEATLKEEKAMDSASTVLAKPIVNVDATGFLVEARGSDIGTLATFARSP